MRHKPDATPEAKETRPDRPPDLDPILAEWDEVRSALAAAEERYLRLIDAVTDYVFTVQVADGRAVRTTHGPNCVAVTGYTAEEFETDPWLWLHMVLDEDREPLRQHVARLMAGEDPGPLEHRLRRKDGSVCWVRNTPVPHRDAAGHLVSYDGLIQDITARKQAEEAVRQSEERFRAMIQNSNDIVLLLDRAGVVSYASEPIRRLLGWEPAELLGQSLFDLVHADDAAALRSLFTRLADQSGAGTSIECRLRRKTGDWTWFEHYLTNLLQSPAIAGLVLNAHDLTERKRAEEERRLLESQIQQAQKLESLVVLAGGIAHDFNNLLTAILGNIDLALDHLSPVSPARDNLKGAERASRRAAELCQQMLAYSGGGRFVVQPLNVAEVVGEMSHMLQSMVPRQVTLRFDLAAGLPPVEADAAQIRQVVLNLVMNAAEAIGDPPGTVRISADAIDCDCDYLASTWIHDSLPAGRYVFLEVADTGCGMDQQTLSRIFDPFFSTKFIGRGLGLPAVLGIVRSHKGAIKVYTEPGQGSTLRVLLPTTLAAPAPPPPESAAWQGQGLILLVDDEEDVRSTAQHMLEHLSFEVITARDGREALALFHQRHGEITAVLLDLTMPNMDGVEAFHQLRRVRADVPVILSSGYNREDVLVRFAGKGLSGFIQKPYALENLRDGLRQVLEPTRASARSTPSESPV